MSDIRQPVFTFSLKNTGKKSNKIEVYDSILFEKGKYPSDKVAGKRLDNAYRIRVNGRWYPKGVKKYFWRSEIRDLIFRSIQF